MNRHKKLTSSKRSKTPQSASKAKLTPKHDEDFNTGSHSPASLRNVGAGYDDTGLGINSKAAARPGKITRDQKTKRKKNQV